jgi:hypothetical protein
LTPIRCDPPEVMNKLDELFPRVEDFPAHHIGPRKIEAKMMLQELGYNVRKFFILNSRAGGTEREGEGGTGGTYPSIFDNIEQTLHHPQIL